MKEHSQLAFDLAVDWNTATTLIHQSLELAQMSLPPVYRGEDCAHIQSQWSRWPIPPLLALTRCFAEAGFVIGSFGLLAR